MLVAFSPTFVADTKIIVGYVVGAHLIQNFFKFKLNSSSNLFSNSYLSLDLYLELKANLSLILHSW